MTDSVLPACMAELQMALSSLEPELTGLEEQRLLPNAEATNAALDAQIAVFTTRKALLETAIGTLQGLEADGYPVLPLSEVPQEVYDELQHNAEEVLAALEHFRALVRVARAEHVGVRVLYANGESERIAHHNDASDA